MEEDFPIDSGRLPVHVGIIMDGNGRWATKRNLPRTAGHKEGLNTAKDIVRCASEMGIAFISLYTFSTENWKRAEEEVSFLMLLIKQHLKKEYNFYRENEIRVIHSGDLSALPKDVGEEIKEASNDTAAYRGLTVNLAINYGGRNEILRAVQRWNKAAENHDDTIQREITEDLFSQYLDQPELPDVDLLIRTGGEKRLSNFLIWKCAYAEFYFDDTLWPDWGCKDFKKAVFTYQKRDRRFGGIK